ncbi:MAG: hypothetical protein H0T92_19775 [Pyrinomonadaceae bacterium]|nr:hypothetical protein [Pyrinomonadaceae bacterium]
MNNEFPAEQIMKGATKAVRNAILTLLAIISLALCSAMLAEGQEASSSYRIVNRDPFVKYKPPILRRKAGTTGIAAAKKVPTVVEPPTVQQRIDRYKAQKLQAMNAQLPAPKPTTALLLSELQVVGIFRTPRGYAAMVEATPIKLSYVVYPGEMFYDGQLVAVEENRLVLRRETNWTSGRREITVEMKSLRQPNAVTDSLTTTTTTTTPSNTPAPAAESVRSKEKASAKL